MTDTLSATAVSGHTLLKAAERREIELDQRLSEALEETIAAHPKFVGSDLPVLRWFNPRRELTREEIIQRIQTNLSFTTYHSRRYWHATYKARLAKMVEVARLARNNDVFVTAEDAALLGSRNFV